MDKKQKALLATSLLDAFTKIWCIKQDDPTLEFECKDCPFELGATCLMKSFAADIGEPAGYTFDDFGSMAR